MRQRARPGAQAVADLYLTRLLKSVHIPDARGGAGTPAEAFVKGRAQVTIFDLAEMIELIGECLAEQASTEAACTP